MVCLRNICINTLHKGDNDDNDDNNNDNSDNNDLFHCTYFEHTSISAHHGQVPHLLFPQLLLLVILDDIIIRRTECLVTAR